MARKTSKKASSRKTTKKKTSAVRKKASKKTGAQRTTKKKVTATRRKSSGRASAKKTSTAKRKSAKRKSTKKTSTAKRKSAKRKSTKRTSTAKKKSAKRKSTKRTSTAKKTTAKRKSTKKAGSCSKRSCSKGTCNKKPLDGRSLVDRAKECRDLEECRKFIVELGDAVEQFNGWLNEMHDQALSAEQARDLYGDQISDLLEAIDQDRRRISELESDLAKARRSRGRSSSSDTVLRKLGELRKEVQTIRSDLKRILDGRQPTTQRRRQATKAKAEKKGRTVPKRSAAETVGSFPKYSVLRGAACSLGVGKYGYPPEVCAPASFPRSVAAEILGTYAQNDYGGLAKWALITGLPIDDGGSPPRVIETAVEQVAPKRSRSRAGAGRRKTGGGRRKAAGNRKKAAKRATKTSMPVKASTSKGRSPKGSGSSQILDQVLLTIARI